MIKQKTGLFDIINISLLCLLLLIFIYPFLYMISVSISDTFAIARGEVVLYPVGFQLQAYKAVFRNTTIWRGYMNSFLYAGLGTILTIIICSLPAYVLTVKEFKHKKIFTTFFVITMFFSGGIIPLFLVIRNLKLLDTMWSIVIPPALSAWSIILFRTNFKQIPDSLTEAAKIDGANHIWVYAKVIIPLSKAILAVVAIYSFVGYWNSYFPALMYLTSAEKQPLMIVLRKFVVVGNFRGEMEVTLNELGEKQDGIGLQRSIKMAIVLVSILPVITIYPFLQKYFISGFMIGGVKE